MGRILPKTYELTARAGDSELSATFGVRSIASDGKQLKINGEPLFLRGTLECCVFPLTGNPPTDEVGWQKTFDTAKAWGLNHLRFHSWCPPEAAFNVADSMGFYLQVEMPLWQTNITAESADVKQFIESEFERIITEYGNHPSLCLISGGNELQKDFDWLNSFVARMKGRDPRHLYTTSSFTFEKGHGRVPEPEDQFFVTQWTATGMGLYCDPSHPALAQFPTDMHSDWQWWHLIKRSKMLNLDGLAAEPVTPIVGVVDNFANNRNLGLVFEARHGEGDILISAIDLLSPDCQRPEHQWLRQSLLSYMQSDAFAPKLEINDFPGLTKNAQP